MPIRLTAASLAVSLALITSACSAPMKNPDIKQNPHPTKRYEVTVTINGAPGAFDSITGNVDYKVVNRECVTPEPISGAIIEPENILTLDLAKVGANVYKGTYYADLMQDEDYYGKGVCQWGVAGAGVLMKLKQVTFSADIFPDDIAKQSPRTRYFSNREFTSAGPFGVEIGSANRSDFKEDADKTFSVTIVAEEDKK